MNGLASILKMTAKVATWVLALVTLLAAYGGHIPPTLWADPSILALVYPYLAIVTLIAGIVWACCHSVATPIVCGAALLFGGGAFTDYFPLRGEKKPEPGEKVFTLTSFNIMHGADIRKDTRGYEPTSNASAQYLIDTRSDIVCLQESHWTDHDQIYRMTTEQDRRLREIYPYCLRNDHPEGGLMVLSRFPARTIKDGLEFQLVEVEIGETRLRILNLHLASYSLSKDERAVVEDVKGVRSAKRSLNSFKGSIRSKLKNAFSSRAGQAMSIAEMIGRTPGRLIVCGDFNDVPGSWAYRSIRGDGLKDAYVQTNTGPMSTYNMYGLHFRIDQVLYRPEGLRALALERGDCDWSDHYPLSAKFAITVNNQ